MDAGWPRYSRETAMTVAAWAMASTKMPPKAITSANATSTRSNRLAVRCQTLASWSGSRNRCGMTTMPMKMGK